MEIIESGEFKSLFDKSKKLIDSARVIWDKWQMQLLLLPVSCWEDILQSRNNRVKKEHNMEQKP
jgi:hypothetical protein